MFLLNPNRIVGKRNPCPLRLNYTTPGSFFTSTNGLLQVLHRTRFAIWLMSNDQQQD